MIAGPSRRKPGPVSDKNSLLARTAPYLIISAFGISVGTLVAGLGSWLSAHVRFAW